MRVAFADRHDAGRDLAGRLARYRERADVVVLGLPRGGVPVAFEVAHALDAPLDAFVVRKLGVPWYPELAMGAVASGGVRVLNDDVIGALGVDERTLDEATMRAQRELDECELSYRGESPPVDVAGRTAVVVDDGLATGATMRAAVAALRERDSRAIVIGVPVASRATCEELASMVEALVCGRTPEPFMAVGLWYGDFSPISDEEVKRLLECAATPAPGER